MKSLIISFMAFCSFGLSACKSFIDIPLPEQEVVSSAVFTTDQTATSAVVGLYDRLSSANLHTISGGGIGAYMGYSADELIGISPTQVNQEFMSNNLTPINRTLSQNMWNLPYQNIYHANALLEGLAVSEGVTNDVRRQLIGETLVLRSLSYFYLVNLFGAIPITTFTDYQANAVLPRTAVPEVLGQLIADTKRAKDSLSVDYPTNDRGRVNRYAASALLVKLYQLVGNWEGVLEETDDLLAGPFQLEENLDEVFLPASRETIWQFISQGVTTQGNTFIPANSTSVPWYQITNQLLNAFELGDARKTHWLGINQIGGTDYHFPYKYKSRVSGVDPLEHTVVFRLAEMLLCKAEALAETGDLAGGVAVLNSIRARVYLPPISEEAQVANSDQLLYAIFKERRIELFLEWGNRWIDLKRTGMAADVLGTVEGKDWQETDILYPIPQSELDQNPFLKQNPGYE